MPADLVALLVSFAYVGAVVVVGEGLRRRLGLPDHLARKLIHVGAGIWVFPTLLLFESRWWAVVPPLAAVAGNYAIQRWRLVAAMGGEAGSWGTVWFPLSLAVLIALFWDRPLLILAGMVPMTAGDPAAALAGRWLGWGPYGAKTLAGTAAMFLVSFVSLLAGLAWLGGPVPGHPAALALVLAAAAALLEAPGRRGTDNLLVPLGTAAAGWGLLALPDPARAVGALAAGVGLSLLIGALAYARGALAETGVLAAVLTGALVFGLGGWGPGVALVYFFVSSSLLSRVAGGRKATAAAHYAKGARRDAGQALANGGVAAALCVAGAATGGTRLLGAALGALAAACADTWATELGALSRRLPRLITSLRAVPAGTSGAVSLPGTLAAAAGALSTGLVAVLAAAAGAGLSPAALPQVAAAGAAGLAGSLVDSLLGATVQGLYRCAVCGTETERAQHCGRPARPFRGAPWLGNDAVNFLATLSGAAAMYLLLP